MTENEVIKELQSQINICESMILYNCNFEHKNDNTNLYKKIETAIEAIKALEEVQEYRKLGTLAKVEEAIEKNKPKNPDYEGDGYSDGKMVYDTWYCPNCGQWYEVDYDDYKYCPECGQKIDWSVNDEKNQPHQEQR